MRTIDDQIRCTTMPNSFQPGDPVVFRVTKRSASPGPNAVNVDPEPLGEDYSYNVDKYWVVASVSPDGSLTLKTRRGKTHVLAPDHPNLRCPNLLERLFKRHRFPQLDQVPPTEQPKAH
jgi:hypothetical protein